MEVINRLKKLFFFRDINQWSLFTMAISSFIAIPIISIAIQVFGGPGEMWDHILEHLLWQYISNSIILLLGTSGLSLVLGVTSAWLVSRYEFPARKLMAYLLFLPLAIPSYIMAYAYVGVFDNGGSLMVLSKAIAWPIGKIDFMNIYGLIWVLSLSLFPYIYASSRAFFTYQSSHIRESAFLLGASERQYFFKVALPIARPAIFAGLFLVLMEVLNDYGAAKYYGINTFTTGIFRTWTALEDLRTAIYLAAILVALVFLLLSLERWQRANRSFVNQQNHQQASHQQRIVLKKHQQWIVFTLVLLPIFWGFILPILQLAYWGFLSFHKVFNSSLLWTAAQSCLLAVLTASVCVVSALGLIYFSKWSRLQGIKFWSKLATIGYVIPGAIIGISIMGSSQFFINFFDQQLNTQIGYLFYGSSFVLIYAYLVRFLAVAYNPLEASSLKNNPRLAESAYLLGQKRIKTLWNIELPLLKPALISAFVLVCIDTLKELPLTLILKPYNIDTLAVKAYEYASDERATEAAIPALILIFSVILLMLITRKWTK